MRPVSIAAKKCTVLEVLIELNKLMSQFVFVVDVILINKLKVSKLSSITVITIIKFRIVIEI